MKIYRFDRETAKSIEEHGSTAATISDIISLQEPASVKCIHIEANGLVGSHPAVNPQLFLVVEGEGYLRGEGAIRTPIQAGQAVHWDKGEWHETSSENGMLAIVIEGPAMEPGQFMPEV
jgi:quercetin dioxygenase-like cupin family protein